VHALYVSLTLVAREEEERRGEEEKRRRGEEEKRRRGEEEIDILLIDPY
jgi:hypothetical protein